MANTILTAIGDHIHEAKLMASAKRIHKELETTSLEQFLAKALPAVDVNTIYTDAKLICQGVDSVYDHLNNDFSREDATAYLNKSLAGHNCNEQGKLMVNLLSCTATPESPLSGDLWMRLKGADHFTTQDISDLIGYTLERLEENAAILARKEFLVMECALEKLPPNRIEAQLGSGKAYATAYAAAMYIDGRRNTEELSSFALGTVAANCVENSKLLARCHYGKVCFDEMKPKLKANLRIALIQLAAYALRVGFAYIMFNVASAVVTVFLSSTLALAIIPLAVAICTVLLYSQEDTIAMVLNIWENVKYLVESIVNGLHNVYQSVKSNVQNFIKNSVEQVENVSTNYV